MNIVPAAVDRETITINDIDSKITTRLDAGTLYVTGSIRNDTIAMVQEGDYLYVDGYIEKYLLAQVKRIQVTGGKGDDTVNTFGYNPNGTRRQYGLGVPMVVDGGEGNDSIDGGMGNDTLVGGAGNDRINGQVGSDSIDGGEGNDALYGGYGDDLLSGDADNDTLYGDVGNDSHFGGTGVDDLNGGADDDYLDGGGEADTFQGNSGTDTYRRDLLDNLNGRVSLGLDGSRDNRVVVQPNDARTVLINAGGQRLSGQYAPSRGSNRRARYSNPSTKTAAFNPNPPLPHRPSPIQSPLRASSSPSPRLAPTQSTSSSSLPRRARSPPP